MSLTSFILGALCVLVGQLSIWFLQSYVRKKGENLATKEDVEEITKKVEEIKGAISEKLELVKLEVGKRATVHRLAAEREFAVLSQIGDALYELAVSTEKLRPIVDYVDPNESESERRNRRYAEWVSSYNSFVHLVQKHRLFLAKSLYLKFMAVNMASRREGIEYDITARSDDLEKRISTEAYEAAAKNIKDMNEKIDAALDAIHKRYEISD
jgi:hypothetical protein